MSTAATEQEPPRAARAAAVVTRRAPAPSPDEVLDTLPFAVVAVTPELAITFANREALHLLALANSDRGALPEPWAEFSLRRFARALCASRAFPAEARARVSAGRVVEVFGRPVPGGAVLVVRDVTARTSDDEADRAFVESAAHELRGSLGGIASAVEALQLGAKEQQPQRDQLLGGVAVEVRALRRQVDGLLVLARAHAEPRALVLERVAVAPLLERVADTLRVHRGVEVETACDERAAVRAMPPLLEVALRNVARNAARHTRRGRITLSGRRLHGDRVSLEVADDGPGIAPRVLDRLFERFATAADGGDGFGIGMPLTREIARVLDGEVDVESDETGTRVRLVLPGA